MPKQSNRRFTGYVLQILCSSNHVRSNKAAEIILFDVLSKLIAHTKPFLSELYLLQLKAI